MLPLSLAALQLPVSPILRLRDWPAVARVDAAFVATAQIQPRQGTSPAGEVACGNLPHVQCSQSVPQGPALEGGCTDAAKACKPDVCPETRHEKPVN